MTVSPRRHGATGVVAAYPERAVSNPLAPRYGKRIYVPVGAMVAMDPEATAFAAGADADAGGHAGGGYLFS